MCGIAGIYAYYDGAPSVDREELRVIRDYMSARGPDGLGEWFSSDRRVALGHRRLSIIDLSERASQPMVCANSGNVISFNGEIYNYKQLRQELESRGYRFHSDSDTEVLLHLYADEGKSMVRKLRGMFAFTIWDQNEKAMFLARDPYGIKPLYYADDGKIFRFASQVKALLTSPAIAKTPDPAGMVGFYLLGSVPEPWTCYEAIQALPAGHTMYVRDGKIQKPEEYFSLTRIWLEAEQDDTEAGDVQVLVRETLLDSVRHHMVSDVPVGAFLSAGVDSGALVGLMAEVEKTERLDNPVQTITLAFKEFKGLHHDEAPIAEQVAKQYGTKHTTRVVTQREFERDLPLILEAMDQPTIDGINTWFVSKAAKEQGLKVVVSGLGGDELFGGYPSFNSVPLWVRRMKLPSQIPLIGDMVRILGKLPLADRIHPKAWGVAKYGGTFPGAWFLARGLFMPWELDQILEPGFIKRGLLELNPIEHIANRLNSSPKSSFAKVSILESSLYMRNQLLRDADWASMTHSLEIRLPLVDIQVLNKLAGTLVKQTHINGKQWVGNSPAMPLPREIIERSKTGFTTPIGRWSNQSNMSGAEKTYQWSRAWACEIGPH